MDAAIKATINQIDIEIANLQKRKKSLLNQANEKHPNKRVNDFLSRYSGTELLKKHKLDEVGTWEVKGEDPNCDLGGPHGNPSLGFFEGTLENVLITAVELKGFWQWGAGGEIIKVGDKVVTKV